MQRPDLYNLQESLISETGIRSSFDSFLYIRPEKKSNKCFDKPPSNVVKYSIKNASPISDVYGELSHLFIVYNPKYSQATLYQNIIENIAARFGDVEVTVLLKSDINDGIFYPFEELVSKISNSRGIPRLNFLKYSKDVNTWCRDYCSIIEGRVHGNISAYNVLEKRCDKAPTHENVVDAINQFAETYSPWFSHKIYNWSSSFEYEEGNILIGDDYMLVGENVLRGRSDCTSQTIATQLSNLFGVETIVPIGCEKFSFGSLDTVQNNVNWKRGRQPIFHIDLFVSLAGRDIHGNEIVIVGDPIYTCLGDENTDDERDGKIIVKRIRKKLNKEIIPSLQKFELTRGRRFKVVRIPMPLAYYRKEGETQKRWYWNSYNNSLVEFISHNDKQVWMPTFGHGHKFADLASFDLQAMLIWESLGFKVNLMTDYNLLAQRQGAIRCITKVLSRK